jgi:hypothetical protein
MNELDLTEAIEAAIRAIRLDDARNGCMASRPGAVDDMARIATEAAAPILERQVREKIAQEIEACADDERAVWDLIRSPFPGRISDGHDHRITRDGLRYAAAIARGSSPSSSTEEKGQR